MNKSDGADSKGAKLTGDGRRRAFWTIFVAALIFACSSVPNIEAPTPEIPHLDKIAHLLIYGLLATLIFRNRPFLSRGSSGALAAVALAVLYGATDEIHQSFTGRTCDTMDLLADAVGAAMAVFMYAKISFYRKFLEAEISLHGRRK